MSGISLRGAVMRITHNQRVRDSRCGRSVGCPSRIRRAVMSMQINVLVPVTYGSRDGDTSSLLLRSLVDLGVVHELSSTLLGKVLGDSGGQSCLSVVDVLTLANRHQQDHPRGPTPMVPMLISASSRSGCVHGRVASSLEVRLGSVKSTTGLSSVASGRQQLGHDHGRSSSSRLTERRGRKSSGDGARWTSDSASRNWE